jgi:hypothetical protein
VKTMTIKQKLLTLISALVVLIAALLSIFFITRLEAISKIHQKVADTTVPLQKVTSTMTVALLNAKLNLNNLVKVDRDIAKFTALKNIVQTNLNDYQILELALLTGNENFGKEIKGLEGLKVPPCEKGGEIESLTKKISSQFEDFKKICKQIIDQKGKEVELSRSMAGADSKESVYAAVAKELDDSLGKLSATQDDARFQSMVFDIHRWRGRFAPRHRAADSRSTISG